MDCLDSIMNYNHYIGFSEFTNSIVGHLIEKNEDIFKLMKYDTNDALLQPILTKEEKRALIYGGESDSASFRIFIQPHTDDSVKNESCSLYIYPVVIIPEDNIMGNVAFNFDIVCHNKINMLSNRKTRIDLMAENLLKTLNGKNIKGVGQFVFDKKANTYDSARLNLYNGKDYFGYTITMSTRISS